MSQSKVFVAVHVVFSVDKRQRIIDDTIREKLHQYIGSVLLRLRSPALSINSVEDHIHILFYLHQGIQLAKAIERVKTASCKWIKSQSAETSRFAWQKGYGAFSVSSSNIHRVRKYIQNQKEHHKKMELKDEIRILNQKHALTI